MRKKPLALEKLVIGEARQTAFGLLYIAKAKGYFKSEGLDVTLSPYPMGRDALTAAMDGSVDVATVFETPVIIRYLKGDPVAVITILHESNKNTALIANRERGINRLEDLRGKRIGVTKGTSAEFLAPSLLRTVGINQSDVKFVNISPKDMASALHARKVDAVAIWNPYLYGIEHSAAPDKLVLFRLNYYMEMSMLAGRRDRIVERSSAILRLLRALYRAENFEKAHPARAIQIITNELTPDDPTIDIQAISKTQHHTLKLNNVLLTSMQQVSMTEGLELVSEKYTSGGA